MTTHCANCGAAMSWVSSGGGPDQYTIIHCPECGRYVKTMTMANGKRGIKGEDLSGIEQQLLGSQNVYPLSVYRLKGK